MSAASYEVTISNGDCDGNITVNKVTDIVYSGNNSTYSTVNLQKIGSTWVVTAFVLSNPSSPCYPSKSFTQDTPDADPIGDYGGGDAEVGPSI